MRRQLALMMAIAFRGANWLPRAMLLLLLLPPPLAVRAFVYQPQVGQIWDPSIIHVNGSFWAVSMYSPKGDKQYPSGFLSRSADGAHWQDVGAIAPSHPNCSWWKGFPLQRPDGSVVLAHGVYDTHGADNTTRAGNDALRILTSRDMRSWTEAATSKPDARWYKPSRWDHMYMKPLNNGTSFVGFPVSEPLNATRYASTWPGVQRSDDGVHWRAEAPLDVRWGAVAPQGIEEGGIERLTLPDGTSRYFLIGGQGGGGGCYQMWSFVSEGDDLMGPYSPTQRRFRLSGGLGGWGTCYSFGALAAWVPPSAHTPALVSQYITPHGGSAGRYDVWMLPLRKPVAAQTADGTPFLRLAYWSGNDALLGPSLQPAPPSSAAVSCPATPTGGGYAVTWVAEFDAATHSAGGYLIANLSASAGGQHAHGGAVGFAIESTEEEGGSGSIGGGGSATSSESTAIVLTVGHESDTDPAATNATILRVVTTISGTISGSGSGAGNATTSTSSVQVIDTAGGFACGGKASPNTTCGVATATAVAPDDDTGTDDDTGAAAGAASGGGGGGRHAVSARLFVRRGMWELYVGELLVTSHTYGYKANASGRVGLACTGATTSASSSSSGGAGEGRRQQQQQQQQQQAVVHASLSDVRVGRLNLDDDDDDDDA